MSTDEFDTRLAGRARDILDLLALPGWRLWDPRVARNPEQRKSLERLHTAIADARRLSRDGVLDDGSRRALLELLDVFPPNEPDALGQLLETVDDTLISAGDDRFLCSLLEIEYARDRVEGGGDVTTWSTLYDPVPIEASRQFAAGGAVEPRALEEARRKLLMLYRARASLYALDRARSGMKAMRLVWLAPVLTVLAAATIVTADAVSDDTSWRTGLLVAVAGALGATLSGAYRLRDQLPRLATLRTFWYAFALQVALGAVAGLFLWIVLESGFVEVADPGSEWAVAAAVAFAAGFSEPFLLKTVERIVGSGAGECEGEKQKPG